FNASGSPVPLCRDSSRMNAGLFQLSASRTLPIQTFSDTCRPSPCVRLSRTRDYYGDCVALGLAALRPSRVSSDQDVQRAFAVSFCPLSGSLPAVHHRELSSGKTAPLYFGSPPILLPFGMYPSEMWYGRPQHGHTWTRIRHLSSLTLRAGLAGR